MELKKYDSVIFNGLDQPIKALVSAPSCPENNFDAEKWEITQIILPKGFAAFYTPGNNPVKLKVQRFRSETRIWQETGAAYAWTGDGIALLVHDTDFGVNIGRREICESWYASRSIVIDGMVGGFRPTDDLTAEHSGAQSD